MLAGVCIFMTENRDGEFVAGGGLYGGNSFHCLAISNNLMTGDHPLFMYASKELHHGTPVYDAYNRFPIFPFLLTGLLTHPFEHSLALQTYAARQLMNVFFFLTIVAVFLLVQRLVGNKYAALVVTLVALSSYYMLSYHDMIFNDIPALLGFVVALHGVVMVQKSSLRISNVLFYSLLPVSFGWQPYAVYATWLLIDGTELLFGGTGPVKKRFSTFVKRPSFVITGVALLWGALVLGLQLFNEWRIVGGSFADLPSVNSALWRTGIASAQGHTQFLWTFDWASYLPAQAHAMALMLIPFWPVLQVEPGTNASALLVISLVAYSVLRYMKDKSAANKVHVVMIFSGLLWTFPMKNFVALHEFQSIFYVGFAVSVYTTLLSLLHFNLSSWRLLAVDISLAFLIALSMFNHLQTQSSDMNRITAEFQNIREFLPQNGKVYVDGDRQRMLASHAIDFFLAGCWLTPPQEADYVVSQRSDYGGEKLTFNSEFNLFKASGK